jgi:hypothetical protein
MTSGHETAKRIVPRESRENGIICTKKEAKKAHLGCRCNQPAIRKMAERNNRKRAPV